MLKFKLGFAIRTHLRSLRIVGAVFLSVTLIGALGPDTCPDPSKVIAERSGHFLIRNLNRGADS